MPRQFSDGRIARPFKGIERVRGVLKTVDRDVADKLWPVLEALYRNPMRTRAESTIKKAQEAAIDRWRARRRQRAS